MANNKMSKYKKEMQGYANLYRMVFRTSSQESWKRDNLILDQALKGKWLSLHTEMKEYYLTREDGSKLRVLKVTSKNHYNKNCTGLLWLHGGGYAISLPELEVLFAERFCADDHCVMILPDYTRSLEAPYPAALMDSYQTLQWMKDHAKELDIRPDQLFVGGESAGGGLTCALTQYARDMKEVNIAFQMPLYPMLDDRMTDTSAHCHAPVWDTKKNLLAWKLYRGGSKENSPYFAPARQLEYSELPPAFSIIGDQDAFFAETKTYFKHLYEAGVEVMLKEYRGCFHAFDQMCPNTNSAKNAEAVEKNAFKYAQEHFFAKQNQKSQEDIDIDDMVKDIETQQKLLDTYKEEPIVEEIVPVIEEVSESSVVEEAIASVEEDTVEEEPTPTTDEETEETVIEEPVEEEPAPLIEEEPVEEATPITEENISEAPVEEELVSEETAPFIDEEIEGTTEEEPAPSIEEELVDEESAPFTEEELKGTPIEESVEETDTPAQATAPINEIKHDLFGDKIVSSEPETDTKILEPVDIKPIEEIEVEERPVSDSTSVAFPDQIDEDEEVISDEEIDEISSKLTDIPEFLAADIEPEEESIEEEPIMEEKVEEPAQEETIKEEISEEELLKKREFTRDDVIKILQKKEEGKHIEKLPFEEDDDEEVDDSLMTNLQKMIENDTTATLTKIDELIDKI